MDTETFGSAHEETAWRRTQVRACATRRQEEAARLRAYHQRVRIGATVSDTGGGVTAVRSPDRLMRNIVGNRARKGLAGGKRQRRRAKRNRPASCGRETGRMPHRPLAC